MIQITIQFLRCFEGFSHVTITGMLKVVVASSNPVKVRAVMDGFRGMFPDDEFIFVGIKTNSGLPDQPVGDLETLACARARVDRVKIDAPDYDYWVGVEGGVSERESDLEAFAWVVVSNGQTMGQARTGSFVLPGRIADLVRHGRELGDADDLVFGKTNSKQENGAVGLLTRDVITRQSLYTHAVMLALIPFKNPDLYT
jgi:inosine/xanthosine triphosphatase